MWWHQVCQRCLRSAGAAAAWQDRQGWFGISHWGTGRHSSCSAAARKEQHLAAITQHLVELSSCHVCPGWHLKNHQLLMEIVKRCSGEDVLFCSLPYPSHWWRKNNKCSRFMGWLVFRSIFDRKIKSNNSFETRSPQTTIRFLYRLQMKLHSNNSLLSLSQFSPWKNNWSY